MSQQGSASHPPPSSSRAAKALFPTPSSKSEVANSNKETQKEILCTVCERPALSPHIGGKHSEGERSRRLKMCKNLLNTMTGDIKIGKEFLTQGFPLCPQCEVDGYQLLTQKEIRVNADKEMDKLKASLTGRMTAAEEAHAASCSNALLRCAVLKQHRLKMKACEQRKTTGNKNRETEKRNEHAKDKQGTHANEKDSGSGTPKIKTKEKTIHVKIEKQDSNRFHCNCKAHYSTERSLFLHLERYNGAAKFTCKLCGKPFYTQVQVDKHVVSDCRKA